MDDLKEKRTKKEKGTTPPSTGEVWISRQEWKARMLNELFRKQGRTGKPGKITAADVKHGEAREYNEIRYEPPLEALWPE